MKHIIPVIMSGGSGTRLWPLSRVAHPKQLHALVSEMTMVQETVARVSGAVADCEFDDPIIVLNEVQHELAESQLLALGVKSARFVIEPAGRNTAPVAAIVAELVAQTAGDEGLILLLPADHHIRNRDAFVTAISKAADLANEGRIVTFGIEPDGPETGYGYIRRDSALGSGFGVKEFTEKPDRAEAKKFLESGEYYWNAGIFLFQAGHLKTEMRQHCPDVLNGSLAALAKAERKAGEILLDGPAFARCPSISFDYAVMERTGNAAVVPASMGWSDVGSWAALWQLAEKDEFGNAARGDATIISGSNNYVIADGRKVAVIGADDLIVVATEDAVLVSRRDDCQDVKLVVNELKAKDRLDLL